MIPDRRSLLREPRAADAPPVGRHDALLAGAYAAVALGEGLLRPDLPWRPWVVLAALVLVPALAWRREHPLLTAVAGWSAAGALAVLQLATGSTDLGLTAMAVVLVLLFSLVRWGSGREILAGGAYVVAVVALGMYAASATAAEPVGGGALVLLVGAVGLVARSRADLARRRQREIRNDERMALARELHDTVAHHVSAIAVQAQAGGVVARLQPERAVEVLAAIESEASRTLAEMRSMVRLLREDGTADYAPQRGVADLPALARADVTPAVEVALDASLTDPGAPAALPPAVDAALYRIAQESVTNAVRHAHGATRVRVEARRDGDVVRLHVEDDGRSTATPALEPGFGLRGMAERVDLLGGSLSAGPGPSGGWVVEAALPAAAPVAR